MHLVDLNPIDTPIEPTFVAENDIVFLLTTIRNPTVGQRVFWKDMDSIRNSNYIAGNPTRFTVHGWNGDGDASVNWRVAERMFRLGDANVCSCCSTMH
jgi:pancreatic triacylglycerol lipase